MHSDIIQKVLDLEEIKSFHCEGEVCFDQMFDENMRFAFSSPVKVTSDGGKLLGFAALFLDFARSCRADIFLTRESPERLDLESGIRNYYLVADYNIGADPANGVYSPQYQVNIYGLFLVIDRADLVQPKPISRARPLTWDERVQRLDDEEG